MLKYKNVKTIDDSDWDNLVQETYGRPYKFQQQYGCQDRGIHHITIPSQDDDEDMNDSIPENNQSLEIGVKFKVWLERDPKQPMINQKYEWELGTFWERNFYPDLQTVANDLHRKGLIDAGDYVININW